MVWIELECEGGGDGEMEGEGGGEGKGEGPEPAAVVTIPKEEAPRRGGLDALDSDIYRSLNSLPPLASPISLSLSHHPLYYVSLCLLA